MIETKAPQISVLIVSYNGRRYLGECLDSVLDQDYPLEDYEVVVVDNASGDGSPEFVRENYPNVRLLGLDHNYGPGSGLQQVRDQLRGRWIAYINQDAIAHRCWLSELVTTLEQHPLAGIVESNMILGRWPEFAGKLRDRTIERAYVCDLTSYGVQDFRILRVTPTSPPIPLLTAYGAGCILNPEVLDQLGYWFDPDFLAYFDDVDVGLRLNSAGFQVLLAPRSVVYHDTIWLFQWNRRSIRRAFLSTRNMILVFYKLGYAYEFLRLLPRLLLGKLLRAGQHETSSVRKVAYFIMGMPLLLVGFGAAVLKMPAYRSRRRETLRHRRTPPGWLVEVIEGLDWQTDPTVWQG